MDANEILNNIGGSKSLNGITFDFSGLLKFPIVILLFGNVLFAALLFFRARILADTFQSSQNSLAKTIISVYLAVTIIGSIIAILFLLVG